MKIEYQELKEKIRNGILANVPEQTGLFLKEIREIYDIYCDDDRDRIVCEIEQAIDNVLWGSSIFDYRDMGCIWLDENNDTKTIAQALDEAFPWLFAIEESREVLMKREGCKWRVCGDTHMRDLLPTLLANRNITSYSLNRVEYKLARKYRLAVGDY